MERITVTENSFANPYPEGLNNFAEIFWLKSRRNYTEYRRELNLNQALGHVSYIADGITYQREYLTSYPDKVLAIHLTASQPAAISGTLSVQLRYVRPFADNPGDGKGKTGAVTYQDGRIRFSGEMQFYQLKYAGELAIKLIGGELKTTDEGIVVSNADEVTVLFTCGTNYLMEPRVWLEEDPKQKLAPYPAPNAEVFATLEKALRFSFEELKQRHIQDYLPLFSACSIDLGGEANLEYTTDTLLWEYKLGRRSHYLEELHFQPGKHSRYNYA